MKKIVGYIKNPKKVIIYLASKGFFDNMSDESYLKLRYWASMGRKLDLKNPQTLNEKLQWLKLYNHNPIYTAMVDKYDAKKVIEKVLGNKYIIPTLGIWNKFDEIDFDDLPNRFVLKCTHDSGGLVICKDKSKLDLSTVKKTINKSMQSSYYKWGREWPYKDVRPRIIAEDYMEELNDDGIPSGKALVDYKFFCFNGYAESVMVCTDRESGSPKFYFFDKDWNLKRYNIRGKNAPKGFTIPKPETMDEMFDVAANLSKGIPFVRVDLYSINNHIYFGEMTFFPDSGFDENLLYESDLYWGKLVNLDMVKTER